MKWFKRKKNAPTEIEFLRKELPLSTLLRWYIYDSGLGEPNDLATLLGLNPVSDEGEEMENADSDMRMKRIEFIMPFLHTIAEMGADVIVSLQVDEIRKENPDNTEEVDKEENLMRLMYKMVGMSALVGAFSSAMEIGLIAPGELLDADLVEMEHDDE